MGYFSHSPNFIEVADEYYCLSHSDCFRNRNFFVSAASSLLVSDQSSSYLDDSFMVDIELPRSARWLGSS